MNERTPIEASVGAAHDLYWDGYGDGRRAGVLAALDWLEVALARGVDLEQWAMDTRAQVERP